MKLVEGGSLADRVPDLVRDPKAAATLAGEGRPGRPLRPPARHPAPRPEAGQRPARRGRDAVRHRLRPGQAGGRGQRDDAVRGDRRHAELHGPGAGPGGEADHDGGRRVRPRGDPVRAAHRPAAVPGRTVMDTLLQVLERGAGPPADGQPAGRPRPGGDRAEVPGEGPGAAVRDGGGAGRRPGPLAAGRTDDGPAAVRAGGGVAVGEAKHHDGDHGPAVRAVPRGRPGTRPDRQRHSREPVPAGPDDARSAGFRQVLTNPLLLTALGILGVRGRDRVDRVVHRAAVSPADGRGGAGHRGRGHRRREPVRDRVPLATPVRPGPRRGLVRPVPGPPGGRRPGRGGVAGGGRRRPARRRRPSGSTCGRAATRTASGGPAADGPRTCSPSGTRRSA